jgi:hypothetical protein
MPNHITSVIEFREAGIMLKTGKSHIVRVLGALKEVERPAPASWEDLSNRAEADAEIYRQYYAGTLAGPQEDPGQASHHPRVPSLFITRDGQALFLQRDWS